VESGRLDREGDETDVALLWDLVLSGQVQAAHLRYAAGVRNLLDWRVAHPVGEDLRDVTLRQPGRTFFVDLSLHW
jgi:outer membrane receptor for ferrienterochelin and colicin